MSDPYHDRFSGIARLYGKTALQRFRTAHVAVIGLGGVGSWTAESLVRSGIGRLTLMDPDDLCITNVNRQLHAIDGTIGKPKTSALAHRLQTINPDAKIRELHTFYSLTTAEELFDEKPDGLVDAIDALRAKCHLLASCHQLGIPVVASGAAGGRRDATRIRIADLAHTSRDSLLASVRKRLRTEHGFPKAPPRGAVPDFGIDAIYSDEAPVFPTCDGEISTERPEDLPGSIGCDAGYGSVTHVTAVFGLAAAGRILERLAES